MIFCLERGADLHMAQLMPLSLTVSCFSKIQIGLTFLVLANPGSPVQRAVKWVCVLLLLFCLHCFNTVGLASGRAWPVKMSDEVSVWLSVWSEVQMVCMWSS